METTEEIKSKKKLPLWALIIAALAVILAGVLITVSITSGRDKPVDEVSARLALADKYMSELNYEQAIAAYNEVLSIEPKCVDAYVGISDAYKALENYPAIIQILENAKEVFGEEPLPEILQTYLEEAYEVAKSGQFMENLTDELVMYGDARTLEDGSVELTTIDDYRSGCVWLTRKVKTGLGFVVSFSYWAGGGRGDAFNGADGFAVSLADQPGLGNAGGDLGFVEGAVGMEIDSYPGNYGDPYGKHFAIIRGEVSNHLSYVEDDRTDDSEWHNVTMLYHNDRLEIYLDSEEILHLDDANLPEAAYIGISASTGSGVNRHMIRDFRVTGAALGETYESAKTTESSGSGTSNFTMKSFDGGNVYTTLDVDEEGQFTVSLSSDTVKGSYEIGITDIAPEYEEYGWRVFFSDGTNTYEVSLVSWRRNASKPREESLYNMQHSVSYDGYYLGDAELEVSGDTLIWRFKIPERSEYFTDMVVPKPDYSKLYIERCHICIAGEDHTYYE